MAKPRIAVNRTVARVTGRWVWPSGRAQAHATASVTLSTAIPDRAKSAVNRRSRCSSQARANPSERRNFR